MFLNDKLSSKELMAKSTLIKVPLLNEIYKFSNLQFLIMNKLRGSLVLSEMIGV